MSGVVTELIRDMRPESILEIGPGWGNYTMDLASICEEMSCLDLSPDVLDYIKLWAKKLNKPEIRTILSKWEDYEEDRTYDIIFAYNCFYRMLHLRECLEKMNRIAREAVHHRHGSRGGGELLQGNGKSPAGASGI